MFKIINKLLKYNDINSYVPFETQLKFMSDKWNDIIPKQDCEYLVDTRTCYSNVYPGYSYRDRIKLNNKYLFEITAHNFDEDKYFNYNYEVIVYLIDDSFDVIKYWDTWHYIECFPKIIDVYKDCYIIKGPWIYDLQQYMNTLQIKEKYLEHTHKIDQQERQRRLDYEQQVKCCNNKRHSILENYK